MSDQRLREMIRKALASGDPNLAYLVFKERERHGIHLKTLFRKQLVGEFIIELSPPLRNKSIIGKLWQDGSFNVVARDEPYDQMTVDVGVIFIYDPSSQSWLTRDDSTVMTRLQPWHATTNEMVTQRVIRILSAGVNKISKEILEKHPEIMLNNIEYELCDMDAKIHDLQKELKDEQARFGELYLRKLMWEDRLKSTQE